MENKFTELCQVGIIIRDSQRLVKNMKEIFGVDPAIVTHTVLDENSIYYGKAGNFEAELIFYRFAGVELEFVRPLKGESVWQDFLDEHGEGIHHVLFNVESYEDAKKQLAASEVPLSQQGSSVLGIPGAKWGYFDTRGKLPFIIEIKNSAEIKKQGTKLAES